MGNETLTFVMHYRKIWSEEGCTMNDGLRMRGYSTHETHTHLSTMFVVSALFITNICSIRFF